jgi:hypothetical protein
VGIALLSLMAPLACWVGLLVWGIRCTDGHLRPDHCRPAAGPVMLGLGFGLPLALCALWLCRRCRRRAAEAAAGGLHEPILGEYRDSLSTISDGDIHCTLHVYDWSGAKVPALVALNDALGGYVGVFHTGVEIRDPGGAGIQVAPRRARTPPPHPVDYTHRTASPGPTA